MDVRKLLDSHGLTHLAETLAGLRDLQSLQTLASDEDALDPLDLISRDAKKLLAADWLRFDAAFRVMRGIEDFGAH